MATWRIKLRVRSHPDEERIARLRTDSDGDRWYARVSVSETGSLTEGGDFRETGMAIIGDSEDDARKRAEALLRDRYEIIGEPFYDADDA